MRRADSSKTQARAFGIARILWVIGGLFALSLTLAIIEACLPDLALPPAIPDATAPIPQAAVGCGDGLIETLDDGGDAGESCDPGDAQAAGCESCQFFCLGSLDDAGGHCYFATIDTPSYAQAVSACLAAGAHLVTFASDREIAVATSLVGDKPYGYWVGLTIDNTKSGYAPPGTARSEPGWPKANTNTACPGCFAPATSVNDAGEFAVKPEDVDASHDCVISKNNTWLQAQCESPTKYATLCEREPIGQRARYCGNLFCTTVPATSGSKRYVIQLFSPASAEQAREQCETYEDGRLAVLTTREEREQLVREIQALNPDPVLAAKVEVWIGLSLKNGQWTWEDGQIEDSGANRPLAWASGQPGSNTGRAYLRIDDSKFDTQLAFAEAQEKPRGFVCQRR